MLLKLKQKTDQFHRYLFPKQHSINIHHSPINSQYLLYYRIFCLVYLSYIYFWGITTTISALNNFLYMTMWGYYLTWLFYLMVVQDYIVNEVWRKGRAGVGHAGKLRCKNLKYYVEIVYEIALCVELPITIIFWGFLFRLILDMKGVTTQIIIVNANMHAGPLILLSIDLVLNSFKFPSQHFHTVIIFQLLYGIINVTYSLAAHIIYKPIDWVSILSYILMLSVLIMTFFMHWLGRYVYNRWKKEKIEGQIRDGLIDARGNQIDGGLEDSLGGGFRNVRVDRKNKDKRKKGNNGSNRGSNSRSKASSDNSIQDDKKADIITIQKL